nr:MAG TPA: replicative DNA helicase [Caudoviricetes sp.]
MAEEAKQEASGFKYDGLLTISTGNSRKSKSWKTKRITWSKLVNRLSKTTYTNERHVDFLQMTKQRQDEIKDVGGFVGGELTGERRTAENAGSRQIVTLDADFAPTSLWDELTMFSDFACLIYSTHKHSKENPRYRVVIPLDRPVTPDEYQAISRKIAADIGIDYFDDTTYQPHRLMYWPSTSKDAEYVFKVQDGAWLSADSVLKTYTDWRNQSEWPVSCRIDNLVKHEIKKQEDPLTKKGIIGAFCKAYTIDEAIDKFLPDIYEACDGKDGRYTYKAGSTAGGAIVYDDKFLYSHHATDPCSMQLCNAFDLVRIHKFKDLDINSRVQDPAKLPSFKAMQDFAMADEDVKRLIAKAKFEEAGRDFSVLDEGDSEPDLSWTEDLRYTKSGEIVQSRYNIRLVLENDPGVKDTFGFDVFSQRIAIRRCPEWRKGAEADSSLYWNDNDEAGLRYLLETTYGLDSRQKIDDEIINVANLHKFHVVREYLNGLEWDGVKRADTLFIDYLGAEDSEYTRAVTRKTLVAAVARIMKPGIKFDSMLVLGGPQGIGKSFILKKLGGKWFNDSLSTVQGKEAYEQLRGGWIFEMSELAALRKSELEPIKQFITKQVDTYRVAYGHQLSDFPRQCVFIGTTNTTNFLRDKSGNRRFWPVDVGLTKPTKSLWNSGTDYDIEQVWAEAVQLYKNGESLILDDDMRKHAEVVQKDHMEENPLEGVIQEYLDMEVPANWYSLDIQTRRDFIKGDGFDIDMTGSFIRDKICILEIWCELMDGKIGNLNTNTRREIKDALLGVDNWEKKVYTTAKSRNQKKLRFGKLYGMQPAWLRKKPDTLG